MVPLLASGLAQKLHLKRLILVKISTSVDAGRFLVFAMQLVLADRAEQKQFMHKNVVCFNPGSFANDISFVTWSQTSTSRGGSKQLVALYAYGTSVGAFVCWTRWKMTVRRTTLGAYEVAYVLPVSRSHALCTVTFPIRCTNVVRYHVVVQNLYAITVRWPCTSAA
jgi:hypothetical protein